MVYKKNLNLNIYYASFIFENLQILNLKNKSFSPIQNHKLREKIGF